MLVIDIVCIRGIIYNSPTLALASNIIVKVKTNGFMLFKCVGQSGLLVVPLAADVYLRQFSYG